jgi:hypothetical protein
MALVLTNTEIGHIFEDHWEESDTADAAWDTAVLHRVVRAESAQSARELLSLGSEPPTGGPTGHMYLMERHARRLRWQVYEAEYHFKGFLNAKENYRVRPRGWSEKQSMPLGLYPGQTTPVPLESAQHLLGITVTYAALTIPAVNDLGSNATPPVLSTAPTNIWSSIPNPIHTYPFGWVLDTREPEILPGKTICLVTDAYVYYHRYKPGGA